MYTIDNSGTLAHHNTHLAYSPTHAVTFSVLPIIPIIYTPHILFPCWPEDYPFFILCMLLSSSSYHQLFTDSVIMIIIINQIEAQG